MKYRSIVLLGILALVATFSLSAQQTLEAKVPFGFWVGRTFMPAGVYTADHSHNGSVLLIRSADWKSSALVIANAVHAPKGFQTTGKMVFNRYGETYFLSQVWRPGYDQGRQLAPTSAERELASAARHAGIESASVPLRHR